jgi:hypothetical protein
VLPATEAGIEEVIKVANWMSSNGFDINRSCGYHVHIDCSDLSVAECAAVAFRYSARRTEFNAILPPSRHSAHWCNPLSGSGLDKVRRAVTGSEERWDSGERYTACNLAHVNGRGRRIEFRQHSGTLNASKIVGWYRLLCDFIAETVRLMRAEQAPVAAPVAAPVVAPVAAAPIVRRQRRRTSAQTRSEVVAVVPGATRIPVIEEGTDYDRFLRCIEARGVATQEDARSFGWDVTRLRVTAHWLRRNGASLVTTERNGELAYVGVDGARTREAIFVNQAQIRRRVETSVQTVVEAPAPVMPVTRSAPQTITNRDALIASLSNAPILQGASNETQAWYRQRREDFASL